MRKRSALFLVVITVFSLVGCGGNNSVTEISTETEIAEPIVTEEVTEAVEEEIIEEIVEEPEIVIISEEQFSEDICKLRATSSDYLTLSEKKKIAEPVLDEVIKYVENGGETMTRCPVCRNILLNTENTIADAYLSIGEPEKCLEVRELFHTLTGNARFNTSGEYVDDGYTYDKYGKLVKEEGSYETTEYIYSFDENNVYLLDCIKHKDYQTDFEYDSESRLISFGTDVSTWTYEYVDANTVKYCDYDTEYLFTFDEYGRKNALMNQAGEITSSTEYCICGYSESPMF